MFGFFLHKILGKPNFLGYDRCGTKNDSIEGAADGELRQGKKGLAINGVVQNCAGNRHQYRSDLALPGSL